MRQCIVLVLKVKQSAERIYEMLGSPPSEADWHGHLPGAGNAQSDETIFIFSLGFNISTVTTAQK